MAKSNSAKIYISEDGAKVFVSERKDEVVLVKGRSFITRSKSVYSKKLNKETLDRAGYKKAELATTKQVEKFKPKNITLKKVKKVEKEVPLPTQETESEDEQE